MTSALICAALLCGCQRATDPRDSDESLQQASLSPLDRRGHLRQDREAACDPVPGQAAPLLPATLGCHMAHCDARMSDNAGLQGPLHPRPQIVVHDGAAPGALPGLGCSSNGEVVACALAPLDGRDALAMDVSRLPG